MKQLKKSKNMNRTKNYKIYAAIVLVILVLATLFYGFLKISYYNKVVDQANIVSIRELILLAVRGVKKDAPVEARSGDIYFPESRLYLPNPGLPLSLTYLYDSGDITDSQAELSVSTYPVRGTEKLYSSQNMEELFAAVPKLQACSRGIKLVSQKFPQDDANNQLVQTVNLSTGKDLFVYIEKDCPELYETAQLFKNIKAY